MEAREMSRREVARQVLRGKRHPIFQNALLTAPDGTRPVVIALPDDTVAEMFSLVNAAGGTATVVVPVPGGAGALDLIPVGPEAALPGQPVVEHDCPVHPDTHVDMLVTYLRRQKGPVRCDVVAPEYGFGPSHAYQDA